MIDSRDWSCVPSYEDYSLPYTILHVDVASLDLTEYLTKILTECDYSFIIIVEWEIVHIRKKLFYVTMNLEQEMATVIASSYLRKSYEQRDGQVITFDIAAQIVSSNIPSWVWNHVTSKKLPLIPLWCDVNMCKKLCANPVLSNIFTMSPGINDRIQKEIAALAPSTVKIKTIIPLSAHTQCGSVALSWSH